MTSKNFACKKNGDPEIFFKKNQKPVLKSDIVLMAKFGISRSESVNNHSLSFLRQVEERHRRP